MNQELLDHWFQHHVPAGDEPDRYEKIRQAGKSFAMVINDLAPESADKTVAIRRVREAVMVANAAIACGGK